MACLHDGTKPLPEPMLIYCNKGVLWHLPKSNFTTIAHEHIAWTVRETITRPLTNANILWAGQAENWPGKVELYVEHMKDPFSGECSRNSGSHTVRDYIFYTIPISDMCQWVDRKHNSTEHGWRNLPPDINSVKETLLQVIVWCYHPARHCLIQCRSMVSLKRCHLPVINSIVKIKLPYIYNGNPYTWK